MNATADANKIVVRTARHWCAFRKSYPDVMVMQSCPCSKFPQGWEALENFAGQPYRHDMVTILCALVSIFAFRFRSRASLELRLLALQHQLSVLRRQRPGRPPLSSLDRLLWVWLYRIWPQIIDAMVLVADYTIDMHES